MDDYKKYKSGDDGWNNPALVALVLIVLAVFIIILLNDLGIGGVDCDPYIELCTTPVPSPRAEFP